MVNYGSKVTVFDNLSSGEVANLKEINDRIIFIKDDVQNFDALKRIIKDQEYIFHLAANASVPASVRDPTNDFMTNALGTFNVLRAMLETNSDAKMVFTSTAGVYGNPAVIPTPESCPPNPLSPYGVSKLTGETYARLFFETYSLRTVSLRYFNVYGPGQPRYVLYDFLKKLRSDPNRLEILGTGNQVRDFIYVSDAIDATMLVLQKGDLGKVYNVGTGKGTKILDFAKKLIKKLKLKTEIVFTGTSWKGDADTFIAIIDRIQGLGFRQKIGIDEGLDNVIEWFSAT